jgi:hypothetical protein
MRLLALPLMAIFEALLIAFCLILALINPSLGLRIIEWSKTLPELEWYLYKDKSC